MPDLIIRAARWPEDATELDAVRSAVFVVEQAIDPELEYDGLDATARHWLALDAGRPVGTLRLLPTGQIGRMAVLAGWRGRGVGSALLQTALEAARASGLGAVWLHAQVPRIGFYERVGFVASGPEFDDAGIPHRQMDLDLD